MIYMDHAATTPLSRIARQRMIALQAESEISFGNPSSLHAAGRRAKEVLEESRSVIARCLNATPDEIFFTSGGTESNNIAIQGASLGSSSGRSFYVAVSTLEHHAVLRTAHYASRTSNSQFISVQSTQEGVIDPQSLSLPAGRGLVSIMLANNEIGTIQPVKELAATAHSQRALFHTDAVQAVGHIPVDVKDLGVDILSLSGHKFGAPKGIGALYIKRAAQPHIHPLFFGGPQEAHMRPGTENILGAAGMAAALQYNTDRMIYHMRYVAELRNYMHDRLAALPGAHVYGGMSQRLPGNLTIGFTGLEGETLQLMLDNCGIYVSTGSACESGSLRPSHVLKAIGCSDEEAAQAIRISLSSENTMDECQYACEMIEKYVGEIQNEFQKK